jgi:CSLREA domain-containing protein
MARFGFAIKQFVRKATLLAGLIAAIALTGATAAKATSYTVTTTSDTSSSGQCTLRDAINAANDSVTAGSSCSTAGSGTDTISFESGLTPLTITLGSSLPAIVSGETLTIQGPTTTPGITVDGASMYQVMSVNSGAALNIDELTIAHGNSDEGGRILNSGRLAVTNSTFSGNSAGGMGGAIENQNKATITGSVFSGNQAVGAGGSIDSQTDSLTVTNSSFSRGGADDGGAVFGSGTFTNTTFSKNNATVGGAVFGSGTFTNCTTARATMVAPCWVAEPSPTALSPATVRPMAARSLLTVPQISPTAPSPATARALAAAF